MSELHLLETKHPDKQAQRRYDALLGLDEHKARLLDELVLMLDRERIEAWRKKHHPKGLPLLDAASPRTPLIVLSGEVGCGKTALAMSIASPLAHELDKRVICLETPSDIRGSGRVGEISARITDAFAQARARATAMGAGILVIDEADDLATSRAQMQAHHEDRAGLNVLIKQIDLVGREKAPLAVLLITNRAAALDPAVLRRAALHLVFHRPNAEVRRAIFAQLLAGTQHGEKDLSALVAATERQDIPFSASDLTDRLGRLALRRAWRHNQPFGPAVLRETLEEISPSPLVDDAPPLIRDRGLL